MVADKSKEFFVLLRTESLVVGFTKSRESMLQQVVGPTSEMRHEFALDLITILVSKLSKFGVLLRAECR